MTLDKHRIRYVTENFDLLQGLRGLPIGVLLLLFADGMIGWSGLFKPGHTTFLDLFIVAACFGLAGWIGVYYKNRFGRVERTGSRTAKNVVTFGAALAAIYFDVTASPPVSLLNLTFTVFFIWMYVEWKERVHYLVIGVILAVLSLLPLLPSVGLDDKLWGSGGGVFLATIGLGLIIGGLFDHRLLVQTLPPVVKENLEHLTLSTES